MSNALYTNAKELFLTGGLNWLTDTIKAVLVNVSYTPNFDSHKFLSDVTGIVPGTAQVKLLAGKSVTGGAADATDLTFPFVSAGQNIHYILLYKDTGVAATSPLITLLDSATGLPVVSTGANIFITFDNGPNKIFAL